MKVEIEWSVFKKHCVAQTSWGEDWDDLCDHPDCPEEKTFKDMNENGTIEFEGGICSPETCPLITRKEPDDE